MKGIFYCCDKQLSSTTVSALLRFNNEDNINVLNSAFPTVCIISAGHIALTRYRISP
jgi:hypothetical protein